MSLVVSFSLQNYEKSRAKQRNSFLFCRDEVISPSFDGKITNKRVKCQRKTHFSFHLRVKVSSAKPSFPLITASVKVHLRHQVLFPGMSYRKLECQHQHALPPHTPCQLVSGKGLTKAHLAVPKEVRHATGFRGKYFCVVAITLSFWLWHSMTKVLRGNIWKGSRVVPTPQQYLQTRSP